MKNVEYKQGMTHVYCDVDKVVVTNRAGRSHVEANVDQIFGMGEFKKLQTHASSEELKSFKAPNPHAKKYEMISSYIPKRAADDLGLSKRKQKQNYEEHFPGLSNND
jgi:hypothetical protein